MRMNSIITWLKSMLTFQNAVILLAFSVSVFILVVAVSSVPDLPPALVGVAGAAVGGGILMLDGWLRHRRIRQEILQRDLLAERVEEYKFIKQEMNRVRERVGGLNTRGVEHLRHPKTLRVSPEFLDPTSGEIRADRQNAETETRRLCESLADLPRLMDARLIFCAPRVLQVFHEAYAEFYAWWIKIRMTGDQGLHEQWPGYESEVQKALDKVTLGTQRAIAEDLGIAGFEVPGTDANEDARKRGREAAKRTMARLNAQARNAHARDE